MLGWLLTVLAFVAVDVCYFGLNINEVYSGLRVVRWWAVGLVYALYPISIYLFLMRHGMTYVEAFFFGLTVYGIYNLTNLGLLDQWSGLLALQDSMWGGIVTAFILFIMYCIC